MDQLAYSNFVGQNREKIVKSGRLKIMSDLAKILDAPIFQYEAMSDAKELMVKLRQTEFDKFCSICGLVGIKEPPLETWMYEHFSLLNKEYDSEAIKRAEEVSSSIEPQLRRFIGKKDLYNYRRICAAFCDLMVYFPIGNISRQQLSSTINHCLIKLGLEPVRPTYTQVKRFFSGKETGPGTECKLLIVGSEPRNMLHMARSLVGWSNIDFHFSWCERRAEEMEKSIMEDAIKTILSTSASIVILDSVSLLLKNSDGMVAAIIRQIDNPPVFIDHIEHLKGPFRSLENRRDFWRLYYSYQGEIKSMVRRAIKEIRAKEI